MSRRHLERHSAGGIRLRLSGRERELLAWLASDLGARLADVAEVGDEDGPDEIRPLQPDDDLVRLFPPAYAEDPEDEREYRELMQDELLDGKRDALRVFCATLERDELTEEELEVWLRVLNDLRLVLGTRLEVTEETYARRLNPRDPDAHELAVYGYLSWLQEQAVEAAAEGLPGR
jgi:hypothetical protein